MIERARGVPVRTLELFDGRNYVEHGCTPHALRMVEREAIGNAPAAIVPDDVEAIEAERAHHLNHVERHRALGVRKMIGIVGGLLLSP